MTAYGTASGSTAAILAFPAGGGGANGDGRAGPHARQPVLTPEESEEQRAPSVGHNSGKAPSWVTPSNLSLDEAARANVGTGRYAEQRRVLIEAIFDPRLGVTPLPLQLLAAVVECINGGTGMAHPGNRYWAERLVSYLNGIPAQYREGALWNAATVVRQAGYAVSEKRAAERGGRAIAHFAITCPPAEEKRAAIEAWCREKRAAERTSKSSKPRPDLTRAMRSPDLTRRMRSDGLTSPVDEGCPHPTGEKNGPTHYTEPGKSNPKTPLPPKGPGTGFVLDDQPVTIETAFEVFWTAFPAGRKRDKGNAQDTFVAIATGKHRKRRATVQVMVDGARRYAASKPDPQYTPLPTTWLNGGRWNDDVPRSSDGADAGADLDAQLEQVRRERRAQS